MIELGVKKLHENAIIPKYQTPGAACFDLHALVLDDKTTIIPARGALQIRTGLAFEIPDGYVLKVYSRSGHGFKNGLRLANSVGVVDSDYKGEVQVKIHNDSNERFTVKHGDRIAQAMLERVDQVRLVEVESLSESERGAGGFGSTGI